jgi:hypothetical protein
MPLPNLTAQQLLAAATEVVTRYPSAELHKNPVGNLSVVVGGEFVAWVDLRTGEVEPVE